MSLWRVAATGFVVATLASACAEPPVKPIPDSSRRSVKVVSADLSGVKHSDTSTIGARGSSEGSKRGAAQGVGATTGGGTLLGLLLAPIGAAVGSAKGASDAQSEQVVDETRANLRIAMQETDFAELLRQRMVAAVAGDIEIAGVTAGSATAPLQTASGKPVAQVMALEYRIGINHAYHVNPEIGVVASVTAQVTSPDRKTLIHRATWTYCSPRRDFVQMSESQAAALRGEIDMAATILAEAIPYDLYISNQPRPLKTGLCMDFSDLPSGRGRAPPPPLS